MTSPVIVRPAETNDVAAIGRLGAMLVTEHYQFDPKRFLAPRPDMPVGYGAFLSSQMEQVDRFVLVAESDGEVVGYVFGGTEGDDFMVLRGPAGMLYDLVVDPRYRKQGIGSRLIEAAFAALRKLGAPRVILFTADRNHGAQQLFARAGFRRTMIEMTRELTDPPPS